MRWKNKAKQKPTITKNKPRKPQMNQDYMCNGRTKKKEDITGLVIHGKL